MQKDKKTKAKEFHKEVSNAKYGKKKTCKKGKKHDYLLTLPNGISPKTQFTAKMIEQYYKIVDEEVEMAKSFDKRYKEAGIMQPYRFLLGAKARYYICSVCGKRDYKYFTV